jgi:hypothetical protein
MILIDVGEHDRNHQQAEEGRGDQAADDDDGHRRAEARVGAEPRAIGSMPAPIAMVVMTIGRARLRQASSRRSSGRGRARAGPG